MFVAAGAVLSIGIAAAPAVAAPDKTQLAHAQGGTRSTGFPGPHNSRISVQLAGTGRFNLGARPDAAGDATGGSYSLTYVWPSSPGTSYTSLNIDGQTVIYGDAPGTQILAPHDDGPYSNTSSWRYGDLEVTQTLTLVSSQTGQDADAVAARYRVTNRGAVSHSLGLRVMQDTDVNNNDAAPFRVPGVGPLSTERDFAGSAVPTSFQIYADLADATHIGAATLRGLSVGADPDRLVIANWGRLYNASWDYTPVVGQATGDSAYAVWWNPQTLAPSATRSYETRIGVSVVSTSLDGNLGLGVSGPQRLSAVENHYSPNPFPVTATVDNNRATAMTSLAATLDLPGSLTLAEGSATKNIGTLGAGQETEVTWMVRAAGSGVFRNLTYSVSAANGQGDHTSVSRDVFVPGLNVPGTLGGAWPDDEGGLTLYYDYGGDHRYLGNVYQGGANWNAADAHVRVQQWPGVPYQLNIPVVDTYRRDTWWGLTVWANDCSVCRYTRNTIYLNQRTLDPESDFQRTKVATHEMGHAFGLAHPADNGSANSSLQTIMRQGRLTINTPQTHDTDQMKALYP